MAWEQGVEHKPKPQIDHTAVDSDWQYSLKPLNLILNHWLVLAGITKTTKYNIQSLISIGRNH